MKQHQVEIDTSKCIGCGMCTRVCPAHSIEIKDKKAVTLLDDCLMCGQCTAVCPMRAVSISGYDTGQIEKKEDFRLKPGEVLNVIRFRRSIRQFKQKEIPKEVISQILKQADLPIRPKTCRTFPLSYSIRKRAALSKWLSACSGK